MKIDEDITIASRRKFLKKLAYGSVLALTGCGVETAAVRHEVRYGHNHAHDQDHARVHPHEHDLDHARVHTRIHAHAHDHAYKQPIHTLARQGYKTLSFEHTHTGEKLKLTYFERGNYIKDALQEINYLLRDFRTDDVHPIDTALLDQLFDVKQTLGLNKPFHIISGYRSPFTNAQLHNHSHAVAKQSFHMQGRAIDIRVEGVSSKMIRNAALNMAKGGVGYYPRDNFVHLDSGRFRTW